ncbi:MAG TPA: HlyD family efflux transporter periplasmic adaptor subunit, partial [Planctomycetota bacterium]|nr:HlyD family efflux transporter periplasmic adaptor subunit [Planctomycetota bacterium]
MTKNRKRLLAILGLLAAAAVATGWLMSGRPEPTTVQTGPVERVATLDSVVTASGEIRAKEFVDLQTEIAGVIVELPVKEGDRVKAGDVLLRIDPFQSKQDVASAQAQFDAAASDESSALVQISMGESAAAGDEYAVAAAESDLIQAESNRDHLKAQLDRRQLLSEQRLISADEFEAAESALRVAESQVASAKAHMEQARAGLNMARVTIDQWKRQHEAVGQRTAVARANLERMQDLLAKTTITSPLTGVITRLNVSKGERAVPGILSNPQATLMTIADLSTIEAEMKVDETDIINVALEDHAKVTVDALGDSELSGHVTEIGNSPIGDTGELASVSPTSQQGKDFKVVVRIEAPPASLRPGLSASAEILVDHRENTLVIPLQAVTVREVQVDDAGLYVPKGPPELEPEHDDADDGTPVAAASRDETFKELEGVFIRDGERARFRPVKLGIKGESEVEVVDGLKEGEEIVTG